VTDVLSPDVNDLLAAWRARVDADKAQVERAREEPDPADFYAPVRHRFHADPRRSDDETLNVLLSLASPDDVWLDVGSGPGRYALPIALRVRQVVAVDPSPSMLELLRHDAEANGISNVRAIEARWPVADPPRADVGLMAHVGYDIAEIGPFLDQLEESSARLCVAVMGESAMTTVSSLFWNEIHGEPRVRLPALPELVTLLVTRGRLPEIRLVDRVPPTFDSFDEALAMARRQLWLTPCSAKDDRLRVLAREALTERDGVYSFDWQPTRIGITSWSATARPLPPRHSPAHGENL
jgi:SAM-dependent methyltransferase